MFLPSRPSPQTRQPIQYGLLQIDLARYQVTFDNRPMDVTPTEWAILTVLAEATPRVVPFLELAQRTQGYRGISSRQASESLRNHLYRLRRKLKEASGDAIQIETVRSVGYLLSSPPQVSQPSGLVTFLFSDIEGSTKLWEQHPQAMRIALRQHDDLLRTAFESCGGYVFKTVGDGFYVAFSRAAQALAAALAGQRALHRAEWPAPTRLRVRMALAAGVVEERDGDYFGPPLNLAARVLAAGHGGQILLAQSAQRELAGEAAPGVQLRDMGMRRFRGLNEPQRIFQVEVADLPAHFSPLHTLDPRPTNLHGELTSFVGREEAIRSIGGLLRRADVRLVTLTGPGGIGKTRLSSQVAASLLDENDDGVFFVPLAPVHDPALIPTTIAQTLGAQESPGRVPMDELIAYLRSRQLLLVLDNFEHLVDAAPLVNDLLRAAPYLKILATSREALQIYGEHIYPVAPLAAPSAQERITLQLLERFPATALFVQRAQAGAPHLALAESDAPTVARICASLDGLPLAIELAAARAGQFSLGEMAEQLQHRLGFLNNGPRDLPARQRTLRGALDWSYDLLSEEEQKLFVRLAVFVGGGSAEAAEHLLAGATHTPGEMTALLQSLAAKSLIQRQPGGGSRYTILESIREYAWERLEASGDLEELRARHARYFAALVTKFETDLTGEQQAAIYQILKAEEDNLRATLEWSLQQAGDTTALALCGILWRWWAAQSRLREGTGWLERALTHQTGAGVALQAKALWGAGRLAFFQADYPKAEKSLQKSLALYRQIEDKDGVAWVLDALGAVVMQREEYEQARRLFGESLALHRAAGNRRGISHSLDDLGQIAFLQGEIEQAAQLFEEGLNLRRQLGSQEGTAVAIVNLSEALGVQGAYQRAEDLLQEGIHIYRQLNLPFGIILCLGNLGQMKGKQGDFAGALVCYLECLNHLREVDEEEEELVAEELLGLAAALHQTGADEAAARVLGLAEDRLKNLEDNLALWEEYEQQQGAVGSRLGQAVWKRAWVEGQRMTLSEMQEALRSL